MTSNAAPPQDASSCKDCQSVFGCMSSGTACAKCEGLLCSKCSVKYPLIVFDANQADESNDVSKNKLVQCFCKSCFQQESLLDFSTTSTVVEPTTDSGNGMTYVFAHGGGGSRAMYMAHAKILASRGYRSILFDFPGHGALMEEPLSLETCVETVQKVLKEHNLQLGENTIYVGGSFGAYVGFRVLKECGEYFKAAILMDCGQNVGPGASLKARAGLWFLGQITNSVSNKAMTGLMLSATEKSTARWKIVESTFGAGFYFDQGAQQVECLKGVAPAEILPNLTMPILFFNGAEDYRDSEDKWLELCQNKQSELKVYEKGDHFFCHDEQFVEDMLDRMDVFSKAVTSSTE